MILRKLVAEGLGTAMLVLLGCGSAVLMGAQIGMLGISLAFGLAVVAAAYGLGAISGAHLNPAVSLGMVLAGRMGVAGFVAYSLAQILGALIGAWVLYLIASGSAGYDLVNLNLGQNGYGPGYLGGYSTGAAFLFELVATFLFVTVILGATGPGAATGFAGLAIGLTLVVIHLAGINVTGVSVNPARSIGPAFLVGGQALSQLWLFLLAPLLGGALAGLLYRAGLTRAVVAPRAKPKKAEDETEAGAAKPAGAVDDDDEDEDEDEAQDGLVDAEMILSQSELKKAKLRLKTILAALTEAAEKAEELDPDLTAAAAKGQKPVAKKPRAP